MKQRYPSAPGPRRIANGTSLINDLHTKPTCTKWTVLRVVLAVTVFSAAVTGFIVTAVAIKRTNYHTMMHHTFLMYLEKHLNMIDGGMHMGLDHMFDGGDNAPVARHMNPGMDRIEYNVPVLFNYNATLNTTYLDLNQTTFVWWGMTFRSPMDLMGARGPRGLQGNEGSQGPPGERGPRGFQGLEGPMGPEGPRGDRGERGEKGERGEPGLIAEVSISNVTAELLESLNYTILRGPVGPQGPMGLKGDRGDRGDRGERGERGLEGVAGPRGADGPRGLQGPVGDAGDDGIHCWDLNADGEPTLPLEDRNGDGIVNVHDCKGEPGPVSVFGTHFKYMVERDIETFPHEQTIMTNSLPLDTLYRIGWSVEVADSSTPVIVRVYIDMTNELVSQEVDQGASGFIYWSSSESNDVTTVPHELKLMMTKESGKGQGSTIIRKASLEFWRIE